MAESEVFAPSEGIVVLGMHRSGTSAFAGTLHLLGFDFGDDLLKGNQFNRGGYWENRAIVRLNDRLLNSLGADWSDVQIAPDCLPDLQREFGSEARALLERTFSGKKNWALKDPRLCLLMDFWREIFAEQNISFIHIFRDPLAVAHSLYRRDRFPIERGLLLWLSQNLNAEFFHQRVPAIFCKLRGFHHRLAVVSECGVSAVEHSPAKGLRRCCGRYRSLSRNEIKAVTWWDRIPDQQSSLQISVRDI
jgi:hypothetical protein